ncbi:unnamed protein product [Nippostrongylus brasiliensis]|uniref:PH domain-containing protein n=1 Tax=Nippostrongylus brasiliensis TaxID=27835 RepID=A0A0N4YYG2_NIPBR|nr:unnamed protein product [Nippostrongylus brasiliensis]
MDTSPYLLLLTDMDQFAMTEKERIKWREELERYCSKKKRTSSELPKDGHSRVESAKWNTLTGGSGQTDITGHANG